MELLEASVRVFVESLTTQSELGESLDALASEMLEVARRSGSEGLDHAVATLSSALPLPAPQESRVAIVVGALVELGADPVKAAPPLVELLSRTYQRAYQFADACEDAAAEAGVDDITQTMRAQIAERLPDPAAADAALNNVSLGALSVLTRSAEARELAREQSRLELRARALAPLHKGAHLVWVLLSVIEDEEVLVLHPESSQGWRVHMRGVSDNRQLHLLLENALPLPGEKPSAEAVQAATSGENPQNPLYGRSAWTLYQWRALRSGQPLPSDAAALAAPHLVVPHTGVPAEIEAFEGTRVIVLGPLVKPLSWNATRTFHELHASLEISETLSRASAVDWIERISSAKR